MKAAGTFFQKPLPSLAEWIGDGARADGFEEWVRETLAMEQKAESADQASALRMIRTLAVAAIELCRSEEETHGRDVNAIMTLLCRTSGVMVGSALLCVMTDDDNRLRLLKLLTEEFREGLKAVLLAEAISDLVKP